MSYLDINNPNGTSNNAQITNNDRKAFFDVLSKGQPTVSVPTISQLRENFPPPISGGQVSVLLVNHLVPEDGGGGVFVWDWSSDAPDNNGTIINPTGRTIPGRWIRLESKIKLRFANIAWFGARPNLEGIDNAPMINAAIQSLPQFTATPIALNGGGIMRTGELYVPTGEWYIQTPIFANGSMSVRGDGASSSFIVIDRVSPYFMQEQTKVITGTSIVSRNFPGLGQGAGNVLSLTVPNHGVPIGDFISGWVSGLVGTSDINLNRWHLLKATGNNTIELIFPEGAAGTYNVTNASVELDYWMLSFFSDSRFIGPGDTFGTVCTDLSLNGRAVLGNIGGSGLYIAGAQSSFVQRVRVWDFGGRGSVCNVSADDLHCANTLRGPGYMCTAGPCMENGLIASEHHNQGALYTIKLSNGNVVPRPAFYLRSATGWTATQVQGEDSPMEFVIDNTVKVNVGLFNVNGPGVANRNGFETTMLHIAGDNYENDFSKTHFQGQFKNLLNDQSSLAVAHGYAGIKTNFLESLRKGNTPLSNPSLLGPFANDAAATAKGVMPGTVYNRGGTPAIHGSAGSAVPLPPSLATMVTTATGGTIQSLSLYDETVFLKSVTTAPVPLITFSLPSVANSTVGQIKTFVSSKNINTLNVIVLGGGIIEGAVVTDIVAYTPISFQCFSTSSNGTWLRLC